MKNPSTHRRRRSWLLLVAAVFSGGCASNPRQTELPPPPDAKLDEIRSDAEQRAMRIIPPQANVPHAVASFQRVDLPLDVPTDAAWSFVDEGAFPALTRGAWNANGLRIGLLQSRNVDKFVKALPPAIGLSRQQLFGGEHPTPVIRTPRLRGDATIDLTVPPMAVHEIAVTGGRLQLLARLVYDDRSTLVLDLVPHHHVPKLTLEPRSALEKELDGRIFEELALRTEIPQNAMLVVGLYRPWPQPDPNQPQEQVVPEGGQLAVDGNRLQLGGAPAVEGSPDTGGPMDEAAIGNPALDPRREEMAPDPAAVEPPPLPNHLGRALFAAQRFNRPLQMLMLITIEPLDAPGP